METTGNYVAYYRVSTDRQGQSGLGLDAQRAAVANYMNGGDWTMVDTFTEVESGRKNDRPELAKALELCRRRRATLVIAKLDRLARNVAFIANLMDANVDLVAVDMPQANRLTLHIMAAMAEHEAQAVSQRTRAALQAAKECGTESPVESIRCGTCDALLLRAAGDAIQGALEIKCRRCGTLNHLRPTRPAAERPGASEETPRGKDQEPGLKG